MNQKNTTNRLGTEAILPLLFKLAVPGIISMFIQALYNVVDSIFVSKISTSALAALSLAFPVQIVLIAIAVGTGIGTTSYISRSLGRGENDLADNAANHSLLLSLFYAIIAFLVGLLFTEHIISLISNDKELIDLCSSYLEIILIGAFSMMIPMISQSILRGEGNTFIPMITLIIGAVLNIILDPIFIFGFGPVKAYGVEGAAIATVLSRIISSIFILYILFKGNNQIKISFSHFNYDFGIIKNIFQVGLPSIIMQLMGSITMAGLNIILGSYSTAAIAVLGIFFRFEAFVLMPVFGLAQGYIPLLGYNYGSKKSERMKQTIKYALFSGSLFTTIGFLIFQFFPISIISLFDQTGDLIDIGVKALKRVSLFYPIVGLNVIASSTFQAIGKGTASLITSFIRQIVFLLPSAYIFSIIWGYDYVWYCAPVSDIISGIIIFIWLKITLSKIFLDMDNH